MLTLGFTMPLHITSRNLHWVSGFMDSLLLWAGDVAFGLWLWPGVSNQILATVLPCEQFIVALQPESSKKIEDILSWFCLKVIHHTLALAAKPNEWLCIQSCCAHGRSHIRSRIPMNAHEVKHACLHTWTTNCILLKVRVSCVATQTESQSLPQQQSQHIQQEFANQNSGLGCDLRILQSVVRKSLLESIKRLHTSNVLFSNCAWLGRTTVLS